MIFGGVLRFVLVALYFMCTLENGSMIGLGRDHGASPTKMNVKVVVTCFDGFNIQ